MKKTIPVLLALAIAAFAPFIHAAEKGSAPAVISHGQKVTLAEHLVAGKITVVDFTSKFCPPCVRISPLLDKLHAQRDDIAVVKVDINRPKIKGIDWKSPVAQQYQLESIPHFKIYDAGGNLIAEGQKAREKVSAWLKSIDS
jgi:thiol-disulfide isomerase/thioredoxin